MSFVVYNIYSSPPQSAKQVDGGLMQRNHKSVICRFLLRDKPNLKLIGGALNESYHNKQKHECQ